MKLYFPALLFAVIPIFGFAMGQQRAVSNTAGAVGARAQPTPEDDAAVRFLQEETPVLVFFDLAQARSDAQAKRQGVLKVSEGAKGELMVVTGPKDKGKALRVDYESGSHWGVLLRFRGRATPAEEWALKLIFRAARGQEFQVNLLDEKLERFDAGRLVGYGGWQEAVLEMEEGVPSPTIALEIQAAGGQGEGWFEIQRAEFFF